MIRLFLVENSSAALLNLRKILARSPEITIVGTAPDGQKALADIVQSRPDVICSEAYLPVLDGLGLVQKLMDVCPTPILIVSSAVHDNPALVSGILAAGAVDALAKPLQEAGFEEPRFARELPRKIKVLAGVSVFRRKLLATAMPTLPLPVAKPAQRVLVMGASVGGPQAFEAVLAKLPANYPYPVICVQHISKGFLDPFILWLDGKTQLAVVATKSGEKPEPGHIYFAPDDANLELDARGCFRHNRTANTLHFPSVDVAFHAIADYYANHIIGVLLTGMGDDGASGLKAIANAGGVTIAQDEASCVVFGMPKTAIEMGAAQKVLNLEQIADMLCHQLNPRSDKYRR